MDEIRIKVFLSSPSDLARERDLFTFVADRLNGEFEGVARFEVVRWEDTFYSATQSFQEQIHAAVRGMAAVDAVICLLWSRIGLKLNPVTWRREDGSGYESGTVFEYKSATALSRKIYSLQSNICDVPHIQNSRPHIRPISVPAAPGYSCNL